MFFFADPKLVRLDQKKELRKAEQSRAVGKVSQTLTLPDGRKIKVMREDAYRAALAKVAREKV